MTRLLHISDTHFGTEVPQVQAALVRMALTVRPDVVVLSGDITQRARPDQFRAAADFMASLEVRRQIVIPGNHDIPLYDLWTRLVRPYARFRGAFGAPAPDVESDELLVVSVLTTRRWRHKNGEVSPAQVEAVARRLQNARPGQLRVVVVHQPLEVLGPRDEHDRLRGHALAARRWAEAGADVVLGGHIHLPYVLPVHARRPGLPRRLWVVQAGTAVSSRVRGSVPNSVNLIHWGAPLPDGVCSVERWDYRAEAGSFEPVSEERVETGWLAAAARD